MHEDDSGLAMSVHLLGCFGSQCRTSATRSRVRARYGLPKEPCSDMVFHSFCQDCAIFQEYKELEARGAMEERLQVALAAAAAAGLVSSTAPAQQAM